MRSAAASIALVLVFSGCSRAPGPERILSDFIATWTQTNGSRFKTHVVGESPDLVSAIDSLRSGGVVRFSVVSIKQLPSDRQRLTATLQFHFADRGVLITSILATVRDGRVRALPSLISRKLTSWEPPSIVEFGSPARGSLASRSGTPLNADVARARPDLETPIEMMERALEVELGGSKGRILLAGTGAREIARVEPRDGGVIRTSLDDELQVKATQAMEGLPGALVVIDPLDGGIRAVVSNPHPSQPSSSPASDGHLPGSTFKIVTAVAMAKANALRLNQRVACPGRVNFGGHVITNFEGEAAGTLTVRDAFARSCNTSFARIGATLGLSRISDAAQDLGLDDTPTFGGAPTEMARPRSQGELATLAIGASNVTTTPVAMAGVAGTIARQGLLVLPHWGNEDPPSKRVIVAAGARDLLGMMEEVVKSGTGVRAAIPGVTLAGKTGTAEVVGPGGVVLGNDAWFLAIAPSRSPRLVVACYLPLQGVGGREAAPLVREFLDSIRTAWIE